MAENNVYVQGSYVDIHDNEVVNLSVDKGEVHVGDNGKTVVAEGDGRLCADVLGDAVQAVQADMWGASAYAVLFCECRDHRGYPNNMAQFERDVDAIARKRGLNYTCSAGTLSDAFRHNSYLEKHVDKWSGLGVKTRSMHLLQRFRAQLP